MSTPARLNGTLFVSETRMLHVGPLVATRRHAHHAARIILAPQGLYIEDGANGRIHAGTAVIPPRLPHRHGACAHVDRAGEQDQDLVATGVDLAVIGALVHGKEAHHAAGVQLLALADLRPELGVHRDRLRDAAVEELHVGVGEMKSVAVVSDHARIVGPHARRGL